MAINLSRSFAKPCDILCDLTVDDVAIPDARVSTTSKYIILNFTGQEPSIKYNGQGYTVTQLAISSPSSHTIEDIRADAELIAIASNPAGDVIFMSCLLRTNTGASKMKSLINSFVPYAVKERPVDVKFGENWSLTQMIPPDPAYYAYKGGTQWAPSGKFQWVVFRSMGNIDPTDYAMLIRIVGSTPPEKMLPRNQEVFFNDTRHISGVPDGKAYMRCRRIKRKGEDQVAPRVTPVKGLEDASKKKEADAKKQPDYGGIEGYFWGAYFWMAQYINRVGAGSVIDTIVFVVAILAGVYAAYTMSQSDRGLTLARTSQNGAKGILRFWNSIIDRIPLPFVGVFRYSGSTV